MHLADSSIPCRMKNYFYGIDTFILSALILCNRPCILKEKVQKGWCTWKFMKFPCYFTPTVAFVIQLAYLLVHLSCGNHFLFPIIESLLYYRDSFRRWLKNSWAKSYFLAQIYISIYSRSKLSHIRWQMQLCQTVIIRKRIENLLLLFGRRHFRKWGTWWSAIRNLERNHGCFFHAGFTGGRNFWILINQVGGIWH